MKSLTALLCALGALLCLFFLSGRDGIAQTQEKTPGRRLEILFLGDQGPHQPQVRYKIIKRHLGRKGINFTYTEQLGDLNAKTLSKYDALMIYANVVRLEPHQEEALLNYVAEGGAFLPIHCASYCFHNSPKYIELVGAQFKSHGTGVFTTDIVKPDHPVMDGYEGFETWDETYVHHRHNDDRVVLQKREDEPWTWVRNHGKGRVFYTAYGHDERCWDQAAFHELIYRGALWAMGDEHVDQLTALDLPELEYEEAVLPNYERRDPPPMAQKPLCPTESMKLAQVPVDMELSLFAHEPEIVNPITMAWDERGRMWVLEALDYPNNMQEGDLGHDRLKIVEDTDGDGKADKFTVFADKLSIPTTIVFANDGVIITDGPDILFLQDTDGDDRADVRKVLFTGWNMGDTHAGPSNFRWGFDNWIWGTVGYSGFRGQVGGQDHRFSMGVFRFKPDGSDIEFLQSTTNNTWGLGFTEEGDVVGSTANDNPSWYHTFPARYYEMVEGMRAPRTPRADVTRDLYMITPDLRQVDAWGNFTAAAGHNIYAARNYPERYWNRLALICGPTGHLLNAGMLEKDGTQYRTVNGGNIYASADAWSAPVAAEVGPDGAVWFCDWYNLIIQHNPTPTRQRGGYDADTGKGNAYVTPLRDREHGRLYRVGWKEAKEVAFPDLSKDDPAGLVAALSNDNMFWRMHAQRLLVERGQTDVADALLKRVENREVDALGLSPGALHAIWTLHGLGVTPQAVKAAEAGLQHPAPGAQRAAVKGYLPRTEANAMTMLSAGLLESEDARLVRDTCLALAEFPRSGAIGAKLLESCLSHPLAAEDEVVGDALTVAAARHAPGFLTAALAKSPDPEAGEGGDSGQQPNLLRNGDFEELDEGMPRFWRRTVYQGAREDDDPAFSVEDDANRGRVLKIVSKRGSDSGLKTFVRVEDDAEYELTGWIRTRDIENVRGGNGAMMNIEGDVSEVRSQALKGTQDWTKVSHRFRSNRNQRIGINCLYGGYGQSTGTAWWDGISLRAVGEVYNHPVDILERVARDIRAKAAPTELAALVNTVSNTQKAWTAPVLAALIGGGSGDDAAGEDAGRVIVLKTQPQKLLYDQNQLSAKAGEHITIRFENNCDLPHNWVLSAPGSMEKVGALADQFATQPDALTKNYVPESPDILHSIRILAAGETGQATFTVDEPGLYPYICTFPGHWRVMNGVLVVE